MLFTTVPSGGIKLVCSLCALDNSLKSYPAQKLPPMPYKTPTYDVLSFSKSSIAVLSKLAVEISTQFRFSGRFMPIVVT